MTHYIIYNGQLELPEGCYTFKTTTQLRPSHFISFRDSSNVYHNFTDSDDLMDTKIKFNLFNIEFQPFIYRKDRLFYKGDKILFCTDQDGYEDMCYVLLEIIERFDD